MDEEIISAVLAETVDIGRFTMLLFAVDSGTAAKGSLIAANAPCQSQTPTSRLLCTACPLACIHKQDEELLCKLCVNSHAAVQAAGLFSCRAVGPLCNESLLGLTSSLCQARWPQRQSTTEKAWLSCDFVALHD